MLFRLDICVSVSGVDASASGENGGYCVGSLVSSLVSLHIRNPKALRMNDRTVNVSTLIQSVRWERGRGSQ